jgi:diguanylate cyclase (GGDEF)-like protein
VLIVDCDTSHLSVMRAMLAPRYRVIEAGDGEQALALLDDHESSARPSVVICEQRMPRMAGVVLCERLRERLPDTILIVMTGFIDVGDIVESINRAGIYKFIVKPYDRDELLLTVERAIEAFDMRRQLHRYVEELEQRVAERTEALEAANHALRLAYAELEKASQTDPLTGLGNRRFLGQALAVEANGDRRRGQASRQAVLMIDIDHFKQINDQYGHAGGDAVLVAFADVLSRHCRSGDLAVRWGGEEFLLCFEVHDEVQALQRAEDLRAGIAGRRFTLPDGRQLGCTCSVGVACLPFDLAQPELLGWEQVAALADHALYLAKHGGRDGVVLLAPERPLSAAAVSQLAGGIGGLISGGWLRSQRPSTTDPQPAALAGSRSAPKA